MRGWMLQVWATRMAMFRIFNSVLLGAACLDDARSDVAWVDDARADVAGADDAWADVSGGVDASAGGSFCDVS